ncbi:MAG: AAA family ATPase, partial [Elusimicrobiota bacterium]|nr:AAA family ATPase [Elusimicrobiota bacterium]
MVDIDKLNAQIKQESISLEKLLGEISQVIVGQRYMLERILVGLLADGHILLEGLPGLAKTLAVKTLANSIDAGFKRIQFTPDLLPADIVGTLIYNP